MPAQRGRGQEEQLMTPTAAEPATQHPPLSPWMSPCETARYLGVALGTLRNWTSARFIPFCKRGGIVRYHRDAIDRWLARGGCPGRTTLADV
jgi:excisionase family DNA binding protein